MRISFLLLYLVLPPAFSHASEIKVEVLTQSTETWTGTSLPDFTEKETEVTILKITISPRTKLPVHKHPVINAGYVLSGEIIVRTEDGKEKHLKAGDTLVEVVDAWHYGRNDTDKPAVIIVFYVGDEGVPLSIKKDPTTDNKQVPLAAKP